MRKFSIEERLSSDARTSAMPSANELLLSATTSAFSAAISSPVSQEPECADADDAAMSPKLEQMSNDSAPSSTSSGDSTLRSMYACDTVRMPIPACSICGGESTGIHFGVEACAACSAFFRRTVVLQKNYTCSKDGTCSVTKDNPGGQKCRACRFQRCNQVGMDRSAVQHRRDAIGKFSSLLKREYSVPSTEDVPGTSCAPFEQCSMSPSPKSPRLHGVLDESVEKYGVLNKRRKLFYTSRSLADIFDDDSVLEPTELTDFGDCMHQLLKIEPRLCADFVSSNKFLDALPPIEKVKIFKNFLPQFQAVEEPYLTYHYGGIEKKFWMMPNRFYMDFSRADHYFETLVMKTLKVDKKAAVRLFLSSFQQAMEIVGGQMLKLSITRTEMIALCTLLMFDPSGQDLNPETKTLLHRLRDQVFRDLLNLYEGDDHVDFPEVRMGNLLLLIAGIKVYAQRTMDNWHLMKIFDIVPHDQIFDELIGIIRKA